MFGGGSGLRLMRFKGVDVYLDVTALLFMGLLIIPQVLRLSSIWSPVEVWGAALLIVVLFIGSILVHELGHAWIGIVLGARVGVIHLHIFGGVTHFISKPASEGRNFWISAIGPLSNLGLWGIFHFAGESSVSGTVWSLVCSYLSSVNFFLAIFNALPGYPMDGGQALRSLVIWLTKNEPLAGKIVLVTGCLTGGLIGLWAVQALAQQDTLGVIFRGLIAYWIITGSIAQYRESQRFAPVKPQPQRPQVPPAGVPVAQLMTQVTLSYPPDISTAQFLQHTASLRLDDRVWLPVLRDGYLLGIINRKLARRVPEGEQATRTLEQAMLARRNLLAVSMDDDLNRGREAVQASRDVPVAVLGAGGVFAGFLLRESF